jgi:putative phosphoribosyl transferase
MRYSDRRHAGRLLAGELRRRIGTDDDVVVLGLPRGGVPVAAEVARALGAPLDVLCVRKLGLPSHPELAVGAIGEDGARVLDPALLARAGVSDSDLAAVETRERHELARQIERFRPGRPPCSVRGRTAVIVDDGLATGSTAAAAAQVVRARGARRVAVAVPVAPADIDPRVLAAADDVIALVRPVTFRAVGEWYDDFSPTSDDEVLAALASVPAATAAPVPAAVGAARTAVRIPAAAVTLNGWLDAPVAPRGLVVFVHGSGSSRFSPRNQQVAEFLHRHGFATLLFDLLHDAEEQDRSNVFDIALLTRRLEHVLAWVETRHELHRLPVGLFGASTGAAAALRAAASGTSTVQAIVCRGGRPDLAMDALGAVRAPVLLIVGGADGFTLERNELAAARLHGPHLVEIVPGAGHLFEEPGALDQVARLAAAWFERFFTTPVVGSGTDLGHRVGS